MKDQWNVRNQLQLLSIIGERKMAESKGSLIAKSVQKHAGRAKEKFLQNLGKVDRTADEIFDDHLHNFTRQQNAANRLQKEFNNYIRCIRAVQTASKTLMESLNEIYESQWPGHDLLFVQSQNIEMLWQDFSHKLGDQVLVPLNTYQSQFPETRKKIDKRGRKLVDFDSQRHNFQSLQSNPRKKDDVKVQKAKEALEEAKRTYELLNSELHDELPALYDSRVLFLVTNLHTFFTAEQVFHSEISKVFSELEAMADKLANDAQRGPKKSPQTNSSNFVNNKVITNASPSSPSAGTTGGDIIPPSSNSPASSPTANASPRPTTLNLNNGVVNGTGGKSLSSPTLSSATTNATTTATATTAAASATTTTATTITTTPGAVSSTMTPASPATNKIVEELYDIPVGATTDNLPPGVLYRVKATYKYDREDSDELSFEVGEIIRVVEYDDPEEQEEGWLMGIKEGSGDKGMFPANFTRPI